MQCAKMRTNVQSVQKSLNVNFSSDAWLPSPRKQEGESLPFFDWPYSGIRKWAFTFKNCFYEIFDAIRIQRRISSSFPVKMLSINLSKFTSKENSGAYSIYSNSEKRQSNAPNKNLPSSYHWEKGTKMKNTCPKRAKFLLFFMFFVSICKFDTISCRRSRYVCLKLIIDWVRELSASTTVTTKQWLCF